MWWSKEQEKMYYSTLSYFATIWLLQSGFLKYPTYFFALTVRHNQYDVITAVWERDINIQVR